MATHKMGRKIQPFYSRWGDSLLQTTNGWIDWVSQIANDNFGTPDSPDYIQAPRSAKAVHLAIPALAYKPLKKETRDALYEMQDIEDFLQYFAPKSDTSIKLAEATTKKEKIAILENYGFMWEEGNQKFRLNNALGKMMALKDRRNA